MTKYDKSILSLSDLDAYLHDHENTIKLED